MATVREHYDQHLGGFYSWMLGDFEGALAAARTELAALGLERGSSGIAVDLGSGPGVHTIPLAELGFSVVALDGCGSLLDRLENRVGSLDVRTVLGDLTTFRESVPQKAEVIVCMGDTLTHLPDPASVSGLFRSVREALAPGGLFVATFRDYVSSQLAGTARFIPVKSDEERILTCFLEYSDTAVMVHDLLHVRGEKGWELRVSAYPKLRLDPEALRLELESLGLSATLEAGPRGMVRLVARAPA